MGCVVRGRRLVLPRRGRLRGRAARLCSGSLGPRRQPCRRAAAAAAGAWGRQGSRAKGEWASRLPVVKVWRARGGVPTTMAWALTRAACACECHPAGFRRPGAAIAATASCTPIREHSCEDPLWTMGAGAIRTAIRCCTGRACGCEPSLLSPESQGICTRWVEISVLVLWVALRLREFETCILAGCGCGDGQCLVSGGWGRFETGLYAAGWLVSVCAPFAELSRMPRCSPGNSVFGSSKAPPCDGRRAASLTERLFEIRMPVQPLRPTPWPHSNGWAAALIAVSVASTVTDENGWQEHKLAQLLARAGWQIIVLYSQPP
jgi:hypothetical protein